MAYVIDVVEGVSVAVSSLTITLPKHNTNELLMICIAQDAGTLTIATTEPGWTNIAGQAATSGQRSAWFYKVATSSSENNPLFTGTSNDWATTAIVIGGADTSTPIDASVRSSWSGATPVNSPSLTTLSDNCLLLYSFSSDGLKYMTADDPSEWINISKVLLGNSNIIGYRQQDSSGSVPTVSMLAESSSEGGNSFIISIKEGSVNSRAPTISHALDVINRHGEYDAITYSDPSLTISTVNGLTVTSFLPAKTYTNSISAPWGNMDTFRCNVNTAGSFVGVTHTLDSALDLTDKNISITWDFSLPFTANVLLSEGFVAVFSDSSGNWSAYQLANRDSIIEDVLYTSYISVKTGASYDSSGTLDITDITKITYVYHRGGSTTSSVYFAIKDLLVQESIILVGGSPVAPIQPNSLGRAMNGWGFYDQALVQGKGQGINKSGIQLGDGTIESYANFTATSYELDARKDLSDEYTNSFIIKASASDSVILESCVIATTNKQYLSIDAASSTSATYSFKGSSIIGWDITWKTGITCNFANITDCTVDQNGGTFYKCAFKDTPMDADDLSEITENSFTSTSTGHAVEIVSLGTGTMSWNNTTSGYAGSNGSTGNEAIYVNVASGTLTINVADGATTPTIRTAGAVVTVVTGQRTLSFTLSPSITGYEWRLYDKDPTSGTIGSTELAGEETATTDNQSYTYGYTSDEDVAIQIIATGYEESLTYPVLLDNDQDLSIILAVDKNT